jgi:hypothetical protein
MMMWEVGNSYIVPMMGEVRDLCQTKLHKNNLTIGLTLPCPEYRDENEQKLRYR